MKLVFLTASAAAILAGCGTVTRGTTEDVPVQVQPSSARVTTDIGMSCTGPCVLKVPRTQSFTVTATAPGYQPASVAVGTRISRAGGWSMAGNAVSAGLIGAGIDLSTGAMKDHFPNPVILVLQPARMDPLPPKVRSSPRGRQIAAIDATRIGPATAGQPARQDSARSADAKPPKAASTAAGMQERRVSGDTMPSRPAAVTDFPLGVNNRKPGREPECPDGAAGRAGAAAPGCAD